MRILHYFRSNIMSGAERVVYDIAQAIQNQPLHEVGIICGGEIVGEYFENIGIPVMVHRGGNILTLHRLIKSFVPDLIHAHDNQASFLALAASGSCPVLSHVHNYYPYFEHHDKNYWLNRLQRPRFRHSLYCSQNLLDRVKLQAPELVYDSSIALNNPVHADRILTQAGVSDESFDRFTIGFFGRMTEQKGLLPFLEALSLHREQIDSTQIQILLVGEGPLEQAILSRIKELHLDDLVTKMDYLKNPYPLMAKIDLMILPSLWEGLPITLLEAAVLKTPVLSMAVGGVEQFIQHGRTGYLCQAKHFDEFIQIMLTSARRDHHELIENAHAQVLDQYDINSYMKRLLAIYYKTVEQS